jgi:hypothetical protein
LEEGGIEKLLNGDTVSLFSRLKYKETNKKSWNALKNTNIFQII